MKIQLAVTNPIDKRIFTNALSVGGFPPPGSAENLDELTREIRQEGVDLVIAEKIFDGIEITAIIRDVRSAAPYRHIPVLAIGTGFTEDEVIAAINAGVGQILLKPFDPELLARKIRATRQPVLAA